MTDALSTPMDRQEFLERLSGYANQTKDRLRDLLPKGEPRDHLYGPIADYVETSGKGLRPALLIATCKAFGGKAQDALTSAAALELLHNAFLIHDDIEDLSEFRRGRRTMHERLGVPLAVNVGDAMQAMALRFLRRNVSDLGATTAWAVFDEFDHLLTQSLEGQAMELGWIRDNALDVTAADYLAMTLKKTCWYSFIHPCRIGALIASGRDHALPVEKLEAFDAFGFYLGAAFQIQDDVLNLIGTQDVYGKEIYGDIFEGKRTLMLTQLSRLATGGERSKLQEFLALPRADRTEADVAWVHERMQSYDCIPYAKSAAKDLVTAARSKFNVAFADAHGVDKDFIAHLMDYMIERDV
ncbi:MAG: polyprenyl synthetase family protein [Sulfitobacter sp.]